VSEVVSSDLSTRGLGRGKLQTNPLGVDLERFGSTGTIDKGIARSKFQLRSDDIVVTMVSEARPEKNTQLLLRAAAQLVAKPWFEHSVFLFVGGGPGEDDNRGLARELGLTAHVRFLGIRQDVPLIYAASDIAGLTSASEGLGLSLLEASASGLPVFGSRVGGIPEVIEDGKNGFLFESGDVTGLAQVLDRLACDSMLRQSMGERGRSRARGSYALDSCVDRLLRVYGELIR
jgi:glycosyltransferase involved in cell wall biosynthesis